MKFKKRVRLEIGLKQIDIAPLIDCIFILLIFFMLTSSFIVVPGINVKLPKALTSDEVNSQSLTIVISSEDIIYLDEKPQTLKEVESFLRKDNYSAIFIKSDRDASLGAVVGVWDICKRLGIEHIGIATTYSE